MSSVFVVQGMYLGGLFSSGTQTDVFCLGQFYPAEGRNKFLRHVEELLIDYTTSLGSTEIDRCVAVLSVP